MTGVTEKIGPLLQLIAFADHEVKHDITGGGKKHIAHWAAEEIERLHQENEKLRDALKGLMQFTPRKEWAGGVENGHYRDAGAALLAAIDRCDDALAKSA